MSDPDVNTEYVNKLRMSALTYRIDQGNTKIMVLNIGLISNILIYLVVAGSCLYNTVGEQSSSIVFKQLIAVSFFSILCSNIHFFLLFAKSIFNNKISFLEKERDEISNNFTES